MTKTNQVKVNKMIASLRENKNALNTILAKGADGMNLQCIAMLMNEVECIGKMSDDTLDYAILLSELAEKEQETADKLSERGGDDDVVKMAEENAEALNDASSVMDRLSDATGKRRNKFGRVQFADIIKDDMKDVREWAVMVNDVLTHLSHLNFVA